MGLICFEQNGEIKGKFMAQKRLMLNGYYGFDNFGDELILMSLIRMLQRQGYELTVLSASPEITRQRYGIGAIHRYNPLQVLISFLRSHAFISGGGGLLQDSTGPNSIIYYGAMLILARMLGLKVMHIFTSVGPITQPLTRRMAAWALKACDFIVVRDEQSAHEVEALTGVRPLVAADAVWVLPPFTQAEKVPNPLHHQGGTTWKIGVSLRPHPRFTLIQQEALARQMATVIEVATERMKVDVYLIACEEAMDVSVLEAFEINVCEGLSPQARSKVTFVAVPQTRAFPTLAGLHWVLGMRYHALVAALLNKVPVYALDYDPKVRMLAKDLALPTTPVDALETLSSEELMRGIHHAEAPCLNALIQSVESAFSALRIILESESR